MYTQHNRIYTGQYMFGTEVWQLPSLEDNGST